jgi:hypothetical protein
MKHCAIRPDAQAFDEIRIITVPRFKQSGLSGDEWRISAEVQFFRKGALVLQRACRNVETACGLLFAWHSEAIDDGKAYFAGDGVTCDQEGCSEPATVRYARKADYCDRGHKSQVFETSQYRHFCEQHKTRGDCGLDDADENYDVVEMDLPSEPEP